MATYTVVSTQNEDPDDPADPSIQDPPDITEMEEMQSHIRDSQKYMTLENNLLYDASSRGAWYHCFRILWCGCFEPYAHITSKYVKEDRWEGCAKRTDTMAWENIYDVQRQQSFCCIIASYAPCCCCIHDMGDIVLFGSDASTKHKSSLLQAGRAEFEPVRHVSDEFGRLEVDGGERWILKRISHSFETFEKITAHLQEIHEEWRAIGRNLQRKIGQV
eukprot:156162_1